MASPSRRKTSSGFTLVELLLSIMILGLAASVISAVYISGIQALDVGEQRVMMDSCLRSKMEELVSTKYGQLASGSQSVSVNGSARTLSWTVQDFDITGGGIPESGIKQVTVQLEGRTVTTLMVDNQSKVGKIS